ncbi:MAG: hypothetical protein AAFN77_17570 [Planctomycetota bacterium]
MKNKPFVRKIIYIALIAVLVIPLAMISLPETRDPQGEIDKPGGKLAQLREEFNLSQAKMSDIDPASETMKLASLGLRGIAVNALWMQAAQHRKEENYDKLRSTLNLLTKIQPNFVKVWEYQAHNLAYNISMEFDDYEQRYAWVKKGLLFLKGGIPHNKMDHRMYDNMGFFTGNKFGKSDEKKSYRRLFRNDNEFHQDMSDVVEPSLYNLGFGYEYDSWQMAYLWYGFSKELVEEKNAQPYRSDVMFYMLQPAQKRHLAMALQEEFPPSNYMSTVWRDADDMWRKYGNQKLTNSIGVTITLEGQNAAQERLEAAKAELDKLVEPGRRAAMIADIGREVLSDEEQALIKADSDQLDEQQNMRAQMIKDRLADLDERLNDKLAMQTKPEDRGRALKLVQDINSIKLEIKTMDRDAETVNYPYWRTRNRIESEPATFAAHEALFNAEQVWRKSTYDDEYEFDYRTKEKKIVRKGAITLYNEAFELWRPIFATNPRLADGQLSDRIIKAVKEYQKMLKFANRPWPEDFPLQRLIDIRFDKGEQDQLPTTTYMKQQREMSDDDTDTSDEIGGKKKPEENPQDPPEQSDKQTGSDDAESNSDTDGGTKKATGNESGTDGETGQVGASSEAKAGETSESPAEKTAEANDKQKLESESEASKEPIEKTDEAGEENGTSEESEGDNQ